MMFGKAVYESSSAGDPLEMAKIPQQTIHGDRNIISTEESLLEKYGITDDLDLSETFYDIVDCRPDNDQFDLVDALTGKTSDVEFENKVRSLEMYGQRSFQETLDRAESIRTEFIDDDSVVDLKKKVLFGIDMEESNRKVDCYQQVQSEKAVHITYEDIDFPNKKAVYQDGNSSPINTVSVRKRDDLCNEDVKMDNGDLVLTVKPPVSIKDSISSDNNSSFVHSNAFVGDSKVKNGHSKVFNGHDTSLMTRNKTSPDIACYTIAECSDPPPFPVKNLHLKPINLSDILAAIKNGSLKENDVKFCVGKGPDDENPTRASKETNSFPKKLAEPSGLGFPSTSSNGFSLDCFPFDSQLTEANTSQNNQAESLIGSHSPPKSVKSPRMSTFVNNDNNNNPLFVDYVHKQVQSCTTSMHFAEKIALPCTSQNKTFQFQARRITTSKTKLKSSQVEKAPTSKVDQNIVSIQNCSNKGSHSSDSIKCNLQKKLKCKQEQKRQTSEYYNRETLHVDHPYLVHSKSLIPNLPDLKRKLDSA